MKLVYVQYNEHHCTTALPFGNVWYIECTRQFSLWVDETQVRVTIQMKAIEQYFHVVLFIMLYKVVLTYKSVDETLVCDHSHESYWAVLPCGTVYCAVQGGLLSTCGWNPSVWPLKWELLSSAFMWYCLLHVTRWFLLFTKLFVQG